MQILTEAIYQERKLRARPKGRENSKNSKGPVSGKRSESEWPLITRSYSQKLSNIWQSARTAGISTVPPDRRPTRAIADRFTEGGRLISNDQDAESLEKAKRNAAEFADRIDFQCGEFSELAMSELDGMVADLGVSRFQLTDPQRGFSFQSEGPLDMRMDQSRGMTAADLINHSAEKAIADCSTSSAKKGGRGR